MTTDPSDTGAAVDTDAAADPSAPDDAPPPAAAPPPASEPTRPNRFAGIHPLFFAIWPVFFLWSQNLGEVDVIEVVGPLLVLAGIAIVATLVLRLILRDIRRAALIVSASIVALLMYGHVIEILDTTPIPVLVQRLAMAAFVLLAVVAALRLAPRTLARLDTALTRISLILLAVTLIGIVPDLIPSVVGRPVLRPTEPTYATTTTAPKRDVYYVIFDRYGSDTSLKLRYGFDNPLTPWLRDRGFTVLDDSHANYVRTGLSLSTTMNMIPFTELAAKMGPTSNDQAPFRTAIKSTVVAKQFKALGYTYHHFGSWWNPTADDPIADVDHRLDTASDFDSVLLQTSAVPKLLAGLGLIDRPLTASTRQYAEGIFDMDTLDDLVDEPGPKFVFGHVLLPHPPLAFDRDGSYLSGADAAAQGLDQDERWHRQVDYTNERIMKWLDALLALPPDQQPIIIVQADEGPYPRGYSADRVNFDWATATPDDLEVKFGITNAWYLPGGEDLGLYPTMTSINTFPTLFDEYFGLDYERFPDTIESSKGWHLPYDLTDITDRVPSAKR